MAYEADGEVTEKQVKPGDSYLRPKGVRHDVKNAGPGPLSFIEIETKP
ncbi:cupin domain-containing protein [Paracoccus methylarcula]|nr:cupin domain-containing protein [Paracoccus methylarcula]